MHPIIRCSNSARLQRGQDSDVCSSRPGRAVTVRGQSRSHLKPEKLWPLRLPSHWMSQVATCGHGPATDMRPLALRVPQGAGGPSAAAAAQLLALATRAGDEQCDEQERVFV
jgi:hypothetical protein